MVMLHLGATEQRRGVVLPLVELAGFLCGHDGDNARRALRRTGIDRHHPTLGDRGRSDITVCMMGSGVVALISVPRGACRLERAIDAVVRLADVFQPID